METVVKIRKYRTLEPKNSEFFTSDSSKNVQFTLSDLAKSGLEPDDMDIYPTSVVNLADGAIAGYQIPYYDLKGQILKSSDNFLTMYRTKFDYPSGLKGSKYPKYLGPSAEYLGKNGLPTSIPYISPKIHLMVSDELIIAEGEKKTAAIIKILSLPAIGIGGCQMWRDPDGSGNIHPWILQLLENRGIKVVKIVPDGDVLRYDICTAYGTLAFNLKRAGYTVNIIHTPDKIDACLVNWGSTSSDNFLALQCLHPDDLVQSPKSLISAYNLAFKTDSKGSATVHQHTSNIMALMERHKAFPEIWLNQDSNTIMIGEESSEPNLTNMRIANYFQYNLGFDKVNSRTIHDCVLSLARGNKKSPFLDWIQNQEWDGTARLDKWLSTHWGVVESPYSNEVGAKWLISACARLDKPGTKIDWMMIVIGPQGVGKTTMPEMFFGKENSLPLYGDQNDKDLHMLMHSRLCIGFDELDSFSKKEASTLKAMITRSEDAFRPPYGQVVEKFPRRFTLYGCGNRYEFIQHDPSGYRRYAVIEVGQLLDFNGLEQNRAQLWAEAWYRYNKGCKFWEVENASVNAEKYVVPNLLEDRVLNWIENERVSKHAHTIKDGKFWFSMTSLMHGIGMEDDVKNTNVTRDIAGIIRKLGATSTNTSGPNGRRGRWYILALDL